MKRLLILLAVVLPTSGFAQMDDLTYLTEVTALAKALVLEEECQLSIDHDAMAVFVTEHFEGRENDLLSGLDGQVTLAEYGLQNASNLQKKLQCAVAEKYITKHGLRPAG